MHQPALHEHRTAAILSIGDELTLGQSLDTNARWLASRLMAVGIVPVEIDTVPDDLRRHTAVLKRLASEVDLIISTGGLGPTADDLTRAALADAMGDALVEDPIALAQVESFYAARGRGMPALNAVQAQRPSRGACLSNLHGTAPGLHARIARGGGGGGGAGAGAAAAECDVFCLPGPPKEMGPMFESHVLPRLRPRAGWAVRSRFLHCFGIGESDLAQRLGGLMDRGRNPLVGTTASGGVVTCRLRFEGVATPDEAEAALDAVEKQVRGVAAAHIFAAGDEKLPGAVVAALKGRGGGRAETFGAVESCTAGMLSAMIGDVPGCSGVFLGSLVTYANEAKVALAGIDAALVGPGGPGAVSAETALAMARGGMERLGVDHCLAITGIAGPDGGTAEKPVGTVFIARVSRSPMDAPDRREEVRRFLIASDRGTVRDWSAKSALMILWQHLKGVRTESGTPVKLLREVPLAGLPK
jgi:nicotinamide-nucleotide amidase